MTDDATTDSSSQEVSDQDAQDVEKLRNSLAAQQAALSAQSRAMQDTSDAYLAAQDKAQKSRRQQQLERQEQQSHESRRSFLKIGGAALIGAAAGVVIGGFEGTAIAAPVATADINSLKDEYNKNITAANNEIVSLQGEVGQLQAQNTSLQTEIDTGTGLLYLNANEATLLEAVAEAVIPSDSSGPGAREAGVLYFIDRQLASDYGTNGTMYMEGPFMLPSTKGPVTVGGVTYSGGTPPFSAYSGAGYQYANNMRYFWRWGLDALQAYSNSAYKANFEALDPGHQVSALQDLWNNVPADFNRLVPSDFAYELFFMIWSGFLTDPLYGGNRGMVGWEYTGFNGTNQGNFYGEGHSVQELMLATTPTRLKPASLAQFQKGSP